MAKKFEIFLAFAIVLIFLVGANLLASQASFLRRANYDMTEEKLYTLSDGTANMLKKLDNDVRIKVFFSQRAAQDEVPGLQQYYDRIRLLLNQITDVAGSKVKVEYLEPRPDSEVEELALKYGLQRIPTRGESVYFGLVALGEVGEEERIPFLNPGNESTLEYDVARLIASVSHPIKPKVGVISSLPVFGGPSGPMAQFQRQQQTPPWVFISELERSYEVEELEATVSEIEKDIEVLIVIHPKSLAEQTQYAIDQFVVRGGRLLVFVDPLSEFERSNDQNPDPSARFSAVYSSDLPKLFKAWGINYKESEAIGDPEHAAEVSNPQTGGREPHYAWLSFGAEDMNQDSLLTADLEQLVMPNVGALRRAEDAPYEMLPLISTSDKAGIIDGMMLKFSSPSQIAQDFESGGESIPIAWSITDEFSTAFPSGKPESLLPVTPGQGESLDGEDDTEGDEEDTHLSEAQAPSTVIVFGDVDMITDQFSVRIQQFGNQRMISVPWDNLPMVMNAVEMLTGSQDLIGLRSRGKSARPFTKVQELEQQASNDLKDALKEAQEEIQRINQEIEQERMGRGGEDQMVLGRETIEKIERQQEELVKVRARERDLRLELRQGVEKLELQLRLLNMVAMPLLVILLSFLPPIFRSLRVRSSRD